MNAGITGHQDLGNETTIAWVKNRMLIELNKLNTEKAFSSLAAGADQLFATLVLSKKIPLIAVIPSRHYEKTFHAGALEAYQSLLEQVSESIQLGYESPSETAFYEAGKFIVNECDTIFAIWNNKPARGLGGTADVVAYAKGLNKQVIHFNPVIHTINYIV